MKRLLAVLLLVIGTSSLMSQSVTLTWNNTETEPFGLVQGVVDPDNRLPYYLQPVSENSSIQLTPLEIEPCNSIETEYLKQSQILIPSLLSYTTLSVTERRQKQTYLKIFPFLERNDSLFKVLSFNILEEQLPAKTLNIALSQNAYSEESVLASGRYVKVSVQESGLYKITYEDLVSMGFKSPSNIRVYGYGGAMLYEDFSKSYKDDLPEVSLYVERGNDGVFGPGDYAIFYGQGIDRWEYNASSLLFAHTRNVYSNYGYYFVTASSTSGVEITEGTDAGTSVGDITSFTDYAVHERDLRNFINSGREFYGEEFSSQTSYTFEHSFPNILSEPATLRLDAAAKSSLVTNFTVSIDNSTIGLLSIYSMANASSYEYAKTASSNFSFIPTSSNLQVGLKYEFASSTGWLNYYEINVKRQLAKVASQPLFFRNPNYLNQNLTHRYVVANATSSLQVWDITNPHEVQRMPLQMSGNAASFIASTNSLREYVAVDLSSDQFKRVTVIGEVGNQNLHALSQCDMAIIAPTLFVSEAERLADVHRAYDGMIVHVVDVNEVYNEFSSGMPDATAYRRFMKMFYDRATDEASLPSYLLLFGDGSFDNRRILESNATNPIYQLLTYQSQNSVYETLSYVSDDYFGMLDDNEGANIVYEKMDIGIGRFPVYNIEQAQIVVDKVANYVENNQCGPWKNQILFMADDGDNNIHVSDADSVANLYKSLNPDMMVRKLYIDAYKQEVSAAGERYPLVKNLFQNYVKSGVLMVNYMGHGGWNGWANEQILYGDEIDNMYNEHLPLWVTATCDFTSFDDFKDTGGERLFRNPNGGAIALFTTTRTVYANPNFQLNIEFTKNLNGTNHLGKPNRLGDVMRSAKNARSAFGDANRMSFSLIGDPALLLGSPRTHKVITDSINGMPFDVRNPDTLKALGLVRLSGSLVTSDDLAFDPSFNGVVYITVLDKEEVLKTLDNDQPVESEKKPYSYRDRPNTIFSGSAEVKNGRFDITFMLPQDIRYNFGNGRLVYYAVDEEQQFEGNGSTENVIVGGEDENAVKENIGPEIIAYLNTPRFKSGDVVNSTPMFVAHLQDVSGINTIGSGIGHDLVLKLNDDPQMEYVLNQYYESVLGNYQEGYVHYQFATLPNGNYSLVFKAWDLQNNSSTVSFDFKVNKDLAIDLFNVYVYPNPAAYEAYFVYEHDRPNAKLELTATIYDLSGRMIWKSEQTAISDNSNSTTIKWNLNDVSGSQVIDGLYLVRLDVCSGNEIKTRKTVKLMINRQ